MNNEIPKHIEHPAVWQSDELFERDDWMYQLLPQEQQAIARRKEIPESLIERCKFVQHALEHGSGISLIRGIPMQSFFEEGLKEFFQTIANYVGTPISQSAAGDKVFSVRNAGFADNDPRARGPNTKKKLSFHTDRCDVIGFLCVKQAKSGGENQVVSSMALFNEIQSQRPDLMEVLMQPYLYKRHTVDTANERPYTEQPVFSFCEGHFGANLLRVLIERAYGSDDTPEMTELQREALDFVEAQAARPELHVTFTQQPGDILFLNNWVTLHRRTAFEDFEELERRRHLLRVWLSMPNSRPIDPMFAGNYGATAAGAIRGGMQAAQQPKS
jgi:hypothetical protein